jgi:hypothetical protein
MSSPAPPEADIQLELSNAVREVLVRHRRGVSVEERIERIRHPDAGWPDFRTGMFVRHSQHGEHTLDFGLDALYATANDSTFHHQSWDGLVRRLDVSLWQRLESGRPLSAREFKNAVLLTNAGAHPGIQYRGSIRIPAAKRAEATAALASVVTDLGPAPDGGIRRVFNSLMPSGGDDGAIRTRSGDGYYVRQTLTGVEAFDEILLKILAPHLSELSGLEAHLGGRSYWHLGLDGGLLVANDRDPVMERFDVAIKRANEGLRFEDPVRFVRDSVRALDKMAREQVGEFASDAKVRDARSAFVMFLSAARHATRHWDPNVRALQRTYMANWRQRAQAHVVKTPAVEFAR